MTTQHSVCVWKSRAQLGVDRLLSLWSERLICVSDAVLSFYRDQARIASHRLTRIYNGIDSSLFDVQLDVSGKRAELGIEEGRVVFVVVGRLLAEKGQELLLQALHSLRQSQRVCGLIVGDGPHCSALRQTAARLGLTHEEVHFLGERHDVPELLCASDVFVLPSRLREGLSLSILEAMASGRPVIVTDVGGNRETVRDGIEGLVIPPNEPDALLAAMRRLAQDADLRSSMGRAGRETVRSRFEIQDMVRSYEQLYDEAMGRFD